jgi:hypothetical protein
MDMLKSVPHFACALILLAGCSRPTPERRASPKAAALDAAVPPLVVRVHRWGGGPASLDHTLEITNDGSVRLHGYDDLWCMRANKSHSAVRTVVDTSGALDARTFEELRALASDPGVLGYPSANGPAHAPEYDGVAADVSLPAHAPILIDGVREAKGKMLRLLELDSEIAGRLGVAAACHD